MHLCNLQLLSKSSLIKSSEIFINLFLFKGAFFLIQFFATGSINPLKVTFKNKKGSKKTPSILFINDTPYTLLIFFISVFPSFFSSLPILALSKIIFIYSLGYGYLNLRAATNLVFVAYEWALRSNADLSAIPTHSTHPREV